VPAAVVETVLRYGRDGSPVLRDKA